MLYVFQCVDMKFLFSVNLLLVFNVFDVENSQGGVE
jgi:hypothetical protein